MPFSTTMAGFGWRATVVLLLLSVGTGMATLNQNQLAEIVSNILNKYRPSYTLPDGSRSFPMFSLAVSIPFNPTTGTYDVSKVTDSVDKVREEILKCNVYTGERMVAATVLRWPNVLKQCPNERVQWSVKGSCSGKVKTWANVDHFCSGAFKTGTADHAEYRTVQKLHTLIRPNGKEDLLIFYVLASPCDKKCASKTHPQNIFAKINTILNWKNYAFVFSNVFKPRSGEVIPEEDLRRALRELGTYKGPLGSIGLNNIFRCNKQSRSAMMCTSCSDGKEVASHCVSG